MNLADKIAMFTGYTVVFSGGIGVLGAVSYWSASQVLEVWRAAVLSHDFYSYRKSRGAR